MNDLIERQDVLDVLRSLAFDYKFQCGENYGEDERQLTIINAGKAIDVIESLPSANLERKAKVEYIAEVYRGEVVDYYLRGMCGICGEYAYDNAKYCSECGAKLDWSNDE